MNLNFFLICFGVLGCYAAFRTVRRGWLRVLMVFFVVICLIKIGFDRAFPTPPYVAQAAIAQPAVQASGGGLHRFVAARLTALEDDRCIMSHLEDTPLSPLAYMLDLHKFLRDYHQTGLTSPGGTTMQEVQQAVTTSFGPQADTNGQAPSLCDQFTSWMQAQASQQLQQMHAPTGALPQGQGDSSDAP